MTIATLHPRPMAGPLRLHVVIVNLLQRHRAVLKGFGPYAAIVLLLPGGSFLALLLWFYRRHQRLANAMTHTRIASVETEGRMRQDNKHGHGPVCSFSRTDLLVGKT